VAYKLIRVRKSLCRRTWRIRNNFEWYFCGLTATIYLIPTDQYWYLANIYTICFKVAGKHISMKRNLSDSNCRWFSFPPVAAFGLVSEDFNSFLLFFVYIWPESICMPFAMSKFSDVFFFTFDHIRCAAYENVIWFLDIEFDLWFLWRF